MYVKLLHKILAYFAKKIIKKYNPLIIGVTGSVGKSSTKEAIYTVLKTKFDVRCTLKNYNNEIGLPLTIFGFSSPGRNIIGWLNVFLKISKTLLFQVKYPKILVLEMAADHPGDIKYLTNIASPRIGVITAVGLTHTEFFKSINAVAREKQVLLKNLKEKDWAILNIDDERIGVMGDKTSAQILTFGLSEKANIQATEIKVDQELLDGETPKVRGLLFKVNYRGSTVPVFLPNIINQAQIYSVLGSIAVGLALGLNLIDIIKTLPKYKTLPGRLNMIPGVQKTLILDDTYNSSPQAVKISLLSLNRIEISPSARKWVVLGDMLELGELSAQAHEETGREVSKIDPDYLIAVGQEAKQISTGARNSGLSLSKIFNFNNASEAGDFLISKIHEGDVILIKGSQGMHLEKIVKKIMLRPEQAKNLLVRQSKKWLG